MIFLLYLFPLKSCDLILIALSLVIFVVSNPPPPPFQVLSHNYFICRSDIFTVSIPPKSCDNGSGKPLPLLIFFFYYYFFNPFIKYVIISFRLSSMKYSVHHTRFTYLFINSICFILYITHDTAYSHIHYIQ